MEELFERTRMKLEINVEYRFLQLAGWKSSSCYYLLINTSVAIDDTVVARESLYWQIIKSSKLHSLCNSKFDCKVPSHFKEPGKVSMGKRPPRQSLLVLFAKQCS